MPQMTQAIDRIGELIEAKRVSLPQLAEKAGVPYTTAVEWRKANWRPTTVAAFEKLANAAEELAAVEEAAGGLAQP